MKKIREPDKKRRRVFDKGANEVAEKLSKLEENEKLAGPEMENQETIDEIDEESDKEEQNNENEEQVSDVYFIVFLLRFFRLQKCH